MRWAGNVARMGDRQGAYRVLVWRPEGKNHLEGLGVDGMIILQRIFKTWDGTISNEVMNLSVL
jgi:hypothetical protein